MSIGNVNYMKDLFATPSKPVHPNQPFGSLGLAAARTVPAHERCANGT